MAKAKITAEPGVPQIVITREFNASPELLLRAHLEPELLVQWLGLRSSTLVVERLEARDGGRWRHVYREADGSEIAFHGVFHGDPSLDGIVQTREFEGWPGHVSLETATFEPNGDRTILRINVVFQTVEARDGLIEAGMEYGLNESYDRLDELFANMAVSRA